MTEGSFSEAWTRRLKELSLEALQAQERSEASPRGDVGPAQRKDAYEKVNEWAIAAKDTLSKAAFYFWAHRGEAASSESITVLVGLLLQVRDDYMCHIIRADSDLTRYESTYQTAAELDQEEQFWKLWDPLFALADSYKEAAFDKPSPGIERVEFELKRREWSSDIRLKLEAFTRRFSGVLDAFIGLQRPS